MMDLNSLLTTLYVVLGIALFGSLGYLYLNKQLLRSSISNFLGILSPVLKIAASKVEDQEKVFDTHDLLVLVSRVSQELRETLENPDLTEQGLEDAIKNAVEMHLQIYRDAGVDNIPEYSAEQIASIVSLIFSNVKVVFEDEQSEDNTSSDS